jgi:hypothetical protein
VGQAAVIAWRSSEGDGESPMLVLVGEMQVQSPAGQDVALHFDAERRENMTRDGGSSRHGLLLSRPTQRLPVPPWGGFTGEQS